MIEQMNHLSFLGILIDAKCNCSYSMELSYKLYQSKTK